MRLAPPLVPAIAALLCAAATLPAQAGASADRHGSGHPHHGYELTPVVALDGPRGVDALGHGRTLVSEADGSVSLVVEHRYGDPDVVPLTSVPPGAVAPAVAGGRHGEVYVLTGGSPPDAPPGDGGATLYVWHWGDTAPTPVFDVAAYQAGDPDPDNLADDPGESNPFGLAALKDGSLLVSDAAGNDLIRVWPETGHAVTVARLKPRVVTVPDTFPTDDPELPPPGTQLPSEAVATSVTVGPDGWWYVGELRGFPATPGTSEIWRIRPGSVGASCDPEHPWRGACRRYADGLTSIVDLGATRNSVLAVTLSKQSWFALESGAPGAEIGGLFMVRRSHGHVWKRELFRDQLQLPGGVDVARHALYLTGPVFGPGALSRAG